MTLGTFVKVDEAGAEPSAPVFHDNIDVPLDNSYPTGGYDFDDLFSSLLKSTRTVIGVKVRDGGYVAGYVPPTYDINGVRTAQGKLKLYYVSSAANAALTEVANATDLHLTTLHLTVSSQ